MNVILAVLFAVGGLAQKALPAEVAQGGDPESVARAWFTATQSRDWMTATALMDLNALITFRNNLIPTLLSEKKGKGRKDILALFQVKSLGEMTDLHPRVFFARLMESGMAEHPGAAEGLAKMSVTFVGSVAEAPDLIHFVYRMSTEIESVSSSSVQVISLQRSAGRWYVLMRSEFKGFR